MTTKLIPKKTWGKSIIAVYYLLVAYKKTIHAKLKHYLESSPSTPFFFTLAPFFAYFIQLTLSKYPFSYEQNAFFQKSIPGLTKPVQKITWETFAYTKHSNKLDLDLITQVNLFDDSFFLSLNPFWKIKKKKLYNGQFDSSDLNWSFVPSRYFYHLLSNSEKQSLITNFSFEGKKSDAFFLKMENAEFNSEVRLWENFKLLSCGPIEKALNPLSLKNVNPPFKVPPLQKSQPSTSLKNLNFVHSKILLNKLKLNARWQFFFNELDDIPTKLNSVFSPGVRSFEPLQKPQLITQNQVMDSNLTPVSPETFQKKLPFPEREISSLKKKGPSDFNETQSDWIDLNFSSPSLFYRPTSELNLINLRPFNGGEVNNLEEKKRSLYLKQFKRNATCLISNYHNLACNLKKDSLFVEKPNHQSNKLLFSTFSLLKFQGPSITKPFFFFHPIFQLKKIGQKKGVNESYLQKNKIIGILNEKNFLMKKPRLSLEKSETFFDRDKNFYEQKKIKTNLKSSNLPLKISSSSDLALSETNLAEPFDYTGVELLTEIFHKKSKKEKSSLFLKRNFHYNLGFGFSQLGKLIKFNVLHPNSDFKVGKNLKTNEFISPLNALEFDEKNNSFDFFSKGVSLKWKKVIRKNLTNSPPIWLSLLNNPTNKDQLTDEPFRSGYSIKPPFEMTEKKLLGNRQPLSLSKQAIGSSKKLNSFLEINLFEKNLLNSLKFNKVMTTQVFEKPELILELFKKKNSRRLPDFFERSSKNLELKNPSQSSFSQTSKTNTARVLKSSNSFAQRKVSGYLYPDSLSQTIALNIRELKGQNPAAFYPNPDSVDVKTALNKTQSPLRKKSTEYTLPISFSFKDLFNFSLKKNNWGLMIQVYQPLTANSGFNPVFSPAIKSPSQPHVSFAKLFQNKEDLQTKINFDNPSTTKKNAFFGKPTKSPIYGVTLQDYLLKYTNPPSRIEKKVLISPYSDPENFLFRVKSNLENKKHLNYEDYQIPSTSKEFFRLAKKNNLTEITKVTSFSKIGLKENKFLSVFKSPLDKIYKKLFTEQKTLTGTKTKIPEKRFFLKISDQYAKAGHQTQPIFYKTHCNYTKSSFLPSSVQSFNKPLIKTSFLTDLYEPFNFKSWTILSQLGLSLMILKGLGVLRNEYSEEIVYYIDQFAASLNEFDKEALKALILKDNFRVIQKTEKNFNDLVGGEFLLTEFGEVILLLRNSRKGFFKIAIPKPKFLSVNEQNNTKLNKFNFFPQELNEGWAKNMKPFVQKKSLVPQAQSFVSNPNLELETLIQKTILLVGPPGTGKTLFVQALAGEAGVPIILESGKMLTTNMEAPGPEKLTDLFKAAREMSPCILFLDEVDTIGQKRDNIISSFAFSQNQKEIPSTLNLIYLQNGLVKDSELSDPIYFGNDSLFKWDILNPVLKFQIRKKTNKNETDKLNSLKIQITNQEQINSKNKDQDLAMLTQLLCELDGITKNQDIIVIGATNRPATLDPALTRPGRFGKIIYLDLPGKQKRFELLKFYSRSLLPSQSFESFSKASLSTNKKSEIKPRISEPFLSNRTSFPQTFSISKPNPSGGLKIDDNRDPCLPSFEKSGNDNGMSFKSAHSLDVNINWDYFANQTVGLSAAHLEAAMNRSSLKVISNYLAKKKKKSIFSPFVNVSKPSSPLKKSFDLNLVDLSNSNKYLFLQKLPKDLKLRLLIQFSKNKNDNFSQLFQTYKKKTEPNLQKLLFASLKQQPFSKTSKTVNKNTNSRFLKQNPLTAFQKRLFSFSLDPKKLSRTSLRGDDPFHTFETIEYGIQTISTMNTNVHLNLTLGNKVIKQLSGQITITDLILPTFANRTKTHLEKKRADLEFPLIKGFTTNFKNNLFFSRKSILKFLKPAKVLKKRKNVQPTQFTLTPSGKTGLSPKKKSLIQSFKKQGKKRKLFYQKHRFYLRTLILLGVKKQAKNFVSLPLKITPEQNKRLFTKIEIKSQILNKYINRIIQNQSLGWLLLNHSTCLIQNPLFNFSIQRLNSKNLNSIYYSFLCLNEWADSSSSFSAQKKPHRLLKWTDFNSISQTLLFGDALFINRSAYYLSGKAFIRFATLNEPKKEKPIRLWTFTGLTQTRHKQKLKSKQFLTKLQFEKFLLSLIAGKATETLMLANYSTDQKKNKSNIGIEELKEFGSLMSLMSEKHLFYSQKQLTQKQININLVKNKSQNQQNETLLFLSQFATLLEIKTQTATHLPSNFLRDQFYLKWVDKPWWQSKSSNLVSSNNLQYGQWYRLFVSEEKQNFRNIEWVAPDTYFHNQVNNRMLLATKTQICNTKSNEEKVENYFINRELVGQYFQFCNLNWNQLQLFESESLTFYFIFESFNKVFTLLEKNRELIDSLVYSLLCHESVRDFEIQNTYQRYLKTNLKSLTETKTEKV